MRDIISGLVKGVAQAPKIAEDDIDVMFSTNVTGLINLTQQILNVFLARPDGGKGDIINVGSIAGREPYPGGSIYCATKAAVRSFTESLRKELVASQIRVIEIDPGQVETVSSCSREMRRPRSCMQWLTPVAELLRGSLRRRQGKGRCSLRVSDHPKAIVRVRFSLTLDSGVEPLTPEDIAEVIVFAAGRRDNVVIADTLIYHKNQAGATSVHRKS